MSKNTKNKKSLLLIWIVVLKPTDLLVLTNISLLFSIQGTYNQVQSVLSPFLFYLCYNQMLKVLRIAKEKGVENYTFWSPTLNSNDEKQFSGIFHALGLQGKKVGYKELVLSAWINQLDIIFIHLLKGG